MHSKGFMNNNIVKWRIRNKSSLEESFYCPQQKIHRARDGKNTIQQRVEIEINQHGGEKTPFYVLVFQ